MYQDEILIRKHITARRPEDAMKIIKVKYPYARMITYKFDKDFRLDRYATKQGRTMSVVFIKDFMKIRENI